MAKRVLVIDGDDQGHFFLSVEGGTMTVGDSPTHAEVVLRDLHIRRIHCEVEVEEDHVLVSDAAAAVQGLPALRQELTPGGALHIGHSHLRLEPAASTPPAAASPPILDDDLPGFADEEPVAVPPVAAPPAAEPTGQLLKRLVVIDGADQGRAFNLPEIGIVTVGNSGKNADIVLHDLYVSRIHCELDVRGNEIVVTHVEGDNGTLINKERITKPQEIRLGDVLRVGNSHLRLEVAHAEAEPAPGALAEEEEAGFEVIEEEEATEEEAQLPHAAVDKLVELEDQVLGHYRVGPLLGRGQTGLVFRAQDLKNGHVVALKVLSPDFPGNAGELERYVRTLKDLAHFHHPNLVALCGAGRTGAYCWFAREHVEGESVARLLQRLNDGARPDWMRACRVTVHLARALVYLQRQKVVHGNITPRNVLIRGSDKVAKLADLLLDRALAGSRLHRAVRGKKLLSELPYQAPEQTLPNAFVDHLADLYAVGAVAYAVLTGRPPFTGETVEEIGSHIRESKVVKPNKIQRGTPLAFEALVLRLLAKHQEDRYQTAADLLAEAEAIAREQEVKV